MARVDSIEVSRLSLDLKNFRTTPQTSEENAIVAMISINPDRFYAIIESIIEDGYMPTENIIVLQDGTVSTVMEGNRRIASLKLILGLIPLSPFNIPDNITKKINELSVDWKSDNSKVPCNVYDLSEADKVDKIVNRTHGKGEKAARTRWPSVATARHNRDVNRKSELGLDLLEKYLKNGSNITPEQILRWSGNYGLTILNEALLKIYNRLGFTALTDLVDSYPKHYKLKETLERLMLDIGLETLGFKEIRNKTKDFAIAYGVPPKPTVPTPSSPTGSTTSSGPASSAPPTTSGSPGGSSTPTTGTSGSSGGSTTTSSSSSGTSSVGSPTTASTSATPPPIAYAIEDPRNVKRLLQKFTPRGTNRQKVVSLKKELSLLDLETTPFAFCFVLRSIFEVSAKAYCDTHSIKTFKISSKGIRNDKSLLELLKEVINHIISNSPDPISMEKNLHGPKTELSTSDGLLSITSLNQLIHSTTFSTDARYICKLFAIIFPLLEAMNS